MESVKFAVFRYRGRKDGAEYPVYHKLLKHNSNLYTLCNQQAFMRECSVKRPRGKRLCKACAKVRYI